jgi:hypothetical protein
LLEPEPPPTELPDAMPHSHSLASRASKASARSGSSKPATDRDERAREDRASSRYLASGDSPRGRGANPGEGVAIPAGGGAIPAGGGAILAGGGVGDFRRRRRLCCK